MTAPKGEGAPQQAAQAAPPAGPPPSNLLRNRDFMLLWGGESVSLLGSRVSVLAVPSVAILALHSGPFVVGVLVALQWVPFLLLGSLAGVWVDRWQRKPVMTFTNIARAVLMALIPIAYVVHVLALWQLYVIAALTGILTVFFQVAFRAYLPTILKREEFIEGNAKLQLSQAVAQVAGTPIAGVLIGWLGATMAIIADAASYVVAAVGLQGIRKKEAPPAPSPASAKGVRGTLADMGTGFRVTWENRILRNLAGMAATGNLALSMASAVMLVYLYDNLKLSPGLVGLALGLGSIGFLIGAFTSRKVTQRLGIGPTLLVCSLLLGVGYLILPVAGLGAALAVVAVSQFFAALQAGPVNVAIMSLVQAVTPPQMMGRVAGVSLTFVWGGNALGGLIGGLLGASLGNAQALLICGLVGLLSGVFVFGPVLRIKTVDQIKQATPVEAGTGKDAEHHHHVSVHLGAHLPWAGGPHAHLPWHFGDGPAASRVRSYSHIGGPN
ncbi:MAG TPA: MFS transporter [Pseudonocardiaceae bacterium]